MMQFKKITPLLFILILGLTYSCKQQNDSVFRSSYFTLENKDLVGLISDYHQVIDSSYRGTGITTVEVLNKIDTVIYTISIIVNRSELAECPPSLFAKVNGKLVLLYTGTEHEVSLDTAYLDFLLKESEEYLFDDSPSTEVDEDGFDELVLPMTYTAVTWQVMYNAEGNRISLDLNPPSYIYRYQFLWLDEEVEMEF